MANKAALQMPFFFIALSPSGFFMQSRSPPLRRGDVGRRMTTAKGSWYESNGVTCRALRISPGVQDRRSEAVAWLAEFSRFFQVPRAARRGQAECQTWANVRWADRVTSTYSEPCVPALKQPVLGSPFILSPSLVFGLRQYRPPNSFDLFFQLTLLICEPNQLVVS